MEAIMEQVFSGAANPKYRLDFEDFVKTRDGAKLYRIIALRDFGEVEKGQKGGYIEGEHNLSQSGNCWVAGLAHVRKQARVEKNALVCDFVEVTDEALLTDDTQASGHAHIGGFARMEDESMAEDHTRIKGTVLMSGRSRAGGTSFLAERCALADNAHVHGSFVGAGTFHLGGDSELDGGTWTGRKPEADLEAVLKV
jgi:hypothetical protein